MANIIELRSALDGKEFNFKLINFNLQPRNVAIFLPSTLNVLPKID